MKLCSACLAGMACKYSGENNNTDPTIVEMVKKGEVIPVCPEMLGGLPTPRVPCEIVGEKVLTKDGCDLSAAYNDGAKKSLAIAQSVGVDEAILMSRSPSCGVGMIYDGSFSGHLIPGHGIFTQMLLEAGIPVKDIQEFNKTK